MSRRYGFTVHSVGLKARFTLYVLSSRGMWVCLCYWTWPRRCGFRVQRCFFFFSSSPRRCQPRYPREHRPQTQRGFFPQYLRNPWPLANGEAPSFCRSNRPSVSSLLPSFGGVFRVQVHCQARHVEAVPQSVWSKNTEWICCFFYLCVLCNHVWPGWKYFRTLFILLNMFFLIWYLIISDHEGAVRYIIYFFFILEFCTCNQSGLYRNKTLLQKIKQGNKYKCTMWRF